MVNILASILLNLINKMKLTSLKSDKTKVLESPLINSQTMQPSMKKNMKNVLKKDLARKNFNEEDAFVSDTVYRLNTDLDPDNDINNYPSPDREQIVLQSLMITMDMLQDIRDLLGCPVITESVFRCLLLNRMLESSDDSQHLKGEAADIKSPKFGTPEEIMLHLKKNNFEVDQCLCEGSWLHVSKKEKGNRNMYGYYMPDHTGKRIFRAI